MSGGEGHLLDVPCAVPIAQNRELQEGWRLTWKDVLSSTRQKATVLAVFDKHYNSLDLTRLCFSWRQKRKTYLDTYYAPFSIEDYTVFPF